MQTQIFRKTFLGLMALGLTLSMFAILSCSSSDDDENNFIQRQAVLTGAAERLQNNDPNPATVNTSGSGTALLTISEDQTNVKYTLTYAGLSNVQQAHIHVGSADVSGPIILFLCTNIGLGTNVPCPGAGPIPNPPACPTSAGTVTGTLTAADLSCKPASATAGTPAINNFADAVTQIQNGNTYTNVHTQTNPGGEIRGENNL
jgi:CHRD domain